MGGESMLEEAGILLPDYIVQGDQTTLLIMVTALIVACLAVVVLLFAFIRMRKKVMGQQSGPKPRFRKRDKVMFYGRKIIRKVRSFSGPSHSGVRRRSFETRRRSSKDYVNLARSIKNILQSNERDKPVLKIKEPPPAILEADIHEMQMPAELRIPPEVLYMLKNIRVFGHFEKPLFLELCRNVETKFIPAGAYLFKRGQPDDSIFVVQSGRLVVFITEPDGTEFEVKEVTQGDSVHSLLSILDVITGYPALYKTVSAKAAVDTTVLRLPAKAFQSVFERFPESLVRVVQMIMVRLQRVTFQTLHNLLGLNVELINTDDTSDKSLAIHGVYSRNSPTKPCPPSGSHSASSVGSISSVEAVTKVLQFDEDPKDTTRLVLSERSSAEESDQDGRSRSDSSSGFKKQSFYKSNKASSLEVDTTGRLAMSLSDFEVAAGRARVHGLDEAKTHKTNNAENNSKPTKKVTIAEDPRETTPRKRHISGDVAYTDEEILSMARDDLVRLLGLDDASVLDAHINLAHIPAGGIVVKEGDQEASLLFVVTGTLLMSQKKYESEEDTPVFTAHPGEFVGEMAVLTGEPAIFTVKARQDCRVIAISKTSFYSIMKECPKVVLSVGHFVVKKLSPFVRQTDFALDWMQLEAGKAVYRQGDPSDCTYIVLNGRLRSVVQLPSGKKELMGEYGRGEIVGVVEVLTMTDRVTTVHAIRDTELAKLPSGMLSLIKRKYPAVVTCLIEILGQRLLGQVQEKVGSTTTLSDLHATTENLSTIAVIPVSDDVPLDRFCLELTHALIGIGSVLRLTSEHILQTLGGSALDSIHEYRLTSWLGQQEDLNRIVLYQADKRMTTWTQRCIRQADCILIVGLSEHEPDAVGPMEKQLENLAVRAQKELIILHKEKDGVYQVPQGTAEWLNARDWCVSHHHIRCPKRMFTKRSPGRVREMYDKLFFKTPDKYSDFARLARFLTGTSIGLILGGGGARGISQVGVIKAMEEHNIPIDMVGGVSIGAFNGAIYCEELKTESMEPRVFSWCQDMSSLWKKVMDITYPITAMFSGRGFNASIRNTFQDKQIEDLWIPYFCITTDITHSKMRVHTNGSLWRYVRASMSLSGYLPPLCDPKDGHLLLDGGYVNNLPADVMKAYGAQTIIAVDVGSEDNKQLTNYGDDLSGWWLLWKRWNPWASPVKVLDLNEIQSRLAYVSCCKQLEEVKNSSYCEYIRPPIDRYKTLMFHKYAEIRDIGYHHGMTVFQGWDRAGYTGEIFRDKGSQKKYRNTQTQKGGLTTFTDLAAMVSRIGQTRASVSERDGDLMYDQTRPSSEGDFTDSVFANLDDEVDYALYGNSLTDPSSEGELLESEDEITPTFTDGMRHRHTFVSEDSIEDAIDEEEQS